MKTIFSTLSVMLCLAAGPSFAAGAVAKGKAKADQVCASCHAAAGDWSKSAAPENPILAGQHADYLVQALTAYKQADKSVMGRKNAVMAAMAAPLTAQEVRDIAAFLAAQPGPLTIKR